MIDYIKRCWKVVATISGALAIIVALSTFYASLATSEDLAQVRAETKAAISEFKKSMDLDRDIARLNQVNDAILQARLLLKSHPNDRDLIETLKALKQDKVKLQERIDKR